MSSYGSSEQKGTVMGIFRSLGALARAFGPLFSSTGRSWDRKNRPAKSPDKVGQWQIFYFFFWYVSRCDPGGLCPNISHFQISYYQIGWPVGQFFFLVFFFFFVNILQCKWLHFSFPRTPVRGPVRGLRGLVRARGSSGMESTPNICFQYTG